MGRRMLILNALVLVGITAGIVVWICRGRDEPAKILPGGPPAIPPTQQVQAPEDAEFDVLATVLDGEIQTLPHQEVVFLALAHVSR